MGIEVLAFFPGCVGGMAIVLLIISGRRNIRRMLMLLSFSIVLSLCVTTLLFSVVIVFEFLQIVILGEIFYLVVVALMIFGGLQFGRTMFRFTTWELSLQAVIAVCGCATITLCFLGWTVRI